MIAIMKERAYSSEDEKRELENKSSSMQESRFHSAYRADR